MKKTIWNYLLRSGLTEAGAAGLMGNLQAESGLIPNRVETICLKRLAEAGKHYTDATYTAFVDDGTISMSEFLHPLPGKQYGYGLAQWTSPDRKAGLYTLAKARKVSIGDVGMQLEWLVTELKTDYISVWRVLSATQDIREASDSVLVKFESPADTGVTVKEARFKMSQKIYDEMKGSGGVQAGVRAQDVVKIMQGWMGLSEADGSFRQIIDTYNTYCAQRGSYPRGYRVPYGVAWCDVTVSAAFIKANAVNLIGGIECGVEEHIKIFRNKGIWIEDGSVMPEVGDIVCYNWDDSTQPNDGYSDHIGIVETIGDSWFTVIEGNMNGMVGRRTVSKGWGYIRGFARPKWSGGVAPAEPADTPKDPAAYIVGTCTVTLKQFLQGAQDPQVKAIQMILNGRGYVGKDGKPLTVDGDLGPNTAYAIEQFQKNKGMKNINFGSVARTTWSYLLDAE